MDDPNQNTVTVLIIGEKQDDKWKVEIKWVCPVVMKQLINDPELQKIWDKKTQWRAQITIRTAQMGSMSYNLRSLEKAHFSLQRKGTNEQLRNVKWRQPEASPCQMVQVDLTCPIHG